MKNHDSEEKDWLHGMTAIAAFLEIPEREGYYLAERGRISAFKFGKDKTGKWRARRSKLREDVERLEAEATAPTAA